VLLASSATYPIVLLDRHRLPHRDRLHGLWDAGDTIGLTHHPHAPVIQPEPHEGHGLAVGVEARDLRKKQTGLR
jgi:hypothetical protein